MIGNLKWTLAGAVLFLAGCSMSPSSKFTLFPSSNRLIDSAKEMRELVAQPAPLPRELEKQTLPLYVVEPGDVLFVQMAELDSPIRLPGDQPVLLDGTINLGSFGHYVAAGKTVEAIQNEVRAQIGGKSGKDPGFITVRLVTRVSKVFYVLGEVNSPGSFSLTGRETVLDGIIAAGGLNDRASRRNIILARPTLPDGCRIVLPVCYRQIVQLGDTSTNYQLAPGDRIFVPSRSFSEQLFVKKKKCGPCTGPEVPCVFGCNGCSGVPGPFAATTPAPYAPMALPHSAAPEGLPAPKVEGK
jgi:polysaccharide export outer membrane protein